MVGKLLAVRRRRGLRQWAMPGGAAESKGLAARLRSDGAGGKG